MNDKLTFKGHEVTPGFELREGHIIWRPQLDVIVRCGQRIERVATRAFVSRYCTEIRPEMYGTLVC